MRKIIKTEQHNTYFILTLEGGFEIILSIDEYKKIMQPKYEDTLENKTTLYTTNKDLHAVSVQPVFSEAE